MSDLQQKHSSSYVLALFFAFEALLKHLLLTGNPLSLQQLCRIAVRRMLGTRASEVLSQLNISHRINSYLQYCDRPISLQTYT